jgi:hypothetical protein
MAVDQCSDILPGLISQRTVSTDDAFERDYINWLTSNDFGSSQSTNSASASAGITIPIEGIPVDFTSKYERGEYSSQSYSKSLATYLRDHTTEQHHFFEKVREANKSVVDAWFQCQKLRSDSQTLGMFCSIAETGNPGEFEVNITYRPYTNDPSVLKISNVGFQADRITPSESYKKTLIKPTGTVLTFKRKGPPNRTLLGGRLKIFTNNSRYECASGESLKYLPLVREPKMTPFCTRTDSGKCVRCEYPLEVSGLAPDSTITHTCLGMPKNDKVKVSFSGSLSVARLRPGSGCWNVVFFVNGKDRKVLNGDSRDSCTFPASGELESSPQNLTGDNSAGLHFYACQWGAERSTCSANGKLVILTPQGQ